MQFAYRDVFMMEGIAELSLVAANLVDDLDELRSLFQCRFYTDLFSESKHNSIAARIEQAYKIITSVADEIRYRKEAVAQLNVLYPDQQRFDLHHLEAVEELFVD